MDVIHPPKLIRGSRVAVVSPSGPVRREHLAFGLETLRSWGLDVVVSEQVFAADGYLAGDDAHRLAALQSALDDPEIEAIFFSRGGYGAMRILPGLDLSGLRRHPKLLVGFSDITALHLYVAGVARVATLHAPVVKSFRLQQTDLKDLKAAVMGTRELEFEVTPVRGAKARGRLLGGNLSLVTSLLASDFCPSLEGAVLLLEDVAEQDYRLDRLFTTLRLSSRCAGLAGIILGDFTDCGGCYVEDAQISTYVRRLASELGEALQCPVVADFPSGHSVRNIASPMGVMTEIDAEAGLVRFASDAALGPKEKSP